MRWMKWLGVMIGLGVFGFGLGAGLNLTRTRPAVNARGPLAGFNLVSDARAAVAAGESVRHTRNVDIAREVSPAVVSIGVTKTTYGRQYNRFYDDLFFAPYRFGPRTENLPYLGSGFIMDEQGHVVTNYHVVEDADSINITLTDQRMFSAELLDADVYVDVALLKIEKLGQGEELPVIKLGDSDDIMIGEPVLAIGNPFGPLIEDPRPSVSAGVISALNRSFRPQSSRGYQRTYEHMIQTDAAINPGNSGGPLINMDAEVIGINTFIFSRSGDSSSVGFSIPINRAKRVAEEIMRYGELRALRIDLEVLSLTPPIIQMLRLQAREGALVRAIDIGGPAERAGLEPGDVIVAVDDIEIRNKNDFDGTFRTRTVGEKMGLIVIRGDQRLDLEYMIEEGRRN